MWDMMVEWTMGATLWDWISHGIAVILVVLFSVPQIWWPHVEKRILKKNKPQQDDNEQVTESQN